MTDINQAQQLSDAVSTMIREDQDSGRTPPDASSLGGPWHVIWRQPDGETQDIGKAVGYATQEEAQAVGRDYLHSHGGGFHLRRA